MYAEDSVGACGNFGHIDKSVKSKEKGESRDASVCELKASGHVDTWSSPGPVPGLLRQHDNETAQR